MGDDLKILKVEYHSNHFVDLKIKLKWPNIPLQILEGRRPPIEDNLKILEVEYPSNHFVDLTKILNLSLDVQTIFYKFL